MLSLEQLQVRFDQIKDDDDLVRLSEVGALLGRWDAVIGNPDDKIGFKQFVDLMTTADREALPNVYRRTLLTVADTVTPISARPKTHTYLMSYNCMPPPIFMILVSAIEVGIYTYYSIEDSITPSWQTGCPGCFNATGYPDIFMFAPRLRYQAWRFVTYMLLHAGLEHILGNLIIQLLLGIPLELVHKFWRIGPLYLCGVIFGAMCQYVMDGDTYLVGASGGVYALLIAHLSNTLLNWSEMPLRYVRVLVIGAYVGLDVGFALYRRFSLGECDAVSYAAHIGGAVTGALLGIAILRNLVAHGWEKVLRSVCLLLYILLFLAFVLVMIFLPPDHEPLEKCPPNAKA